MRKSNPDTVESSPARLRCAIYTRKSTEEGLEQEFNSLDAQREAGEAFIESQRREGWIAVPALYDDGGFTGANMERPALTRLLHAVEARELDCVVVYKVDRLSRSLLDSTRMLSVFEKHNVSFVAVTQQFNTSTSLGRLTLNILLSFAQFERELIGERTRDKMLAARRKGKWVGGCPVLGYDIDPGGGRLVVNEEEAERVRAIFALCEEHGSQGTLAEIERRGWHLKSWTPQTGRFREGGSFTPNSLRRLPTRPRTGFDTLEEAKEPAHLRSRFVLESRYPGENYGQRSSIPPRGARRNGSFRGGDYRHRRCPRQCDRRPQIR